MLSEMSKYIIRTGATTKILKERGFQLPFLQQPSDEYSLKTLAWHLLHEEVQKGDHNATEDAQTTMKLYLLDQFKFEDHVHLRDMEW